MGAAAIALRHPARHAPGGSGGAVRVVCLVAYPFLLPGADHEAGPTGAGRPPRRGRRRTVYLALAALVVIAIAGAVIEDAGSSWATLYLRDGLGRAGGGRGARVCRGGRLPVRRPAARAIAWWTASVSARWRAPVA